MSTKSMANSKPLLRQLGALQKSATPTEKSIMDRLLILIRVLAISVTLNALLERSTVTLRGGLTLPWW